MYVCSRVTGNCTSVSLYCNEPSLSELGHSLIAPVAETGFSLKLTAYKIVGHFFGLSYRKISGSNQVKNCFFRIINISVPCLHAQLRSGTVIKKLWTFFRTRGRDHSRSPPCWIFRVKQIHPSTASGKDETANSLLRRHC